MGKNCKKDSEQYNTEGVKYIYAWKNACKVGDEDRRENLAQKIHDFYERFVNGELWKSYRALMSNSEHRENIIQDVWLVFFARVLPRYDTNKGAFTTYSIKWMKGVVNRYYSWEILGTTPYYGAIIAKIRIAMYDLKNEDVEITPELLAKTIGESEITVQRACEILARKDKVSYEALLESGKADGFSEYMEPETVAINNEAKKVWHEFMKKGLNAEERSVLSFYELLNNAGKKTASYTEIADSLNKAYRDKNPETKQKYYPEKIKKIIESISVKESRGQP